MYTKSCVEENTTSCQVKTIKRLLMSLTLCDGTQTNRLVTYEKDSHLIYTHKPFRHLQSVISI